MSVIEIENELKQMSDSQRLVVNEIATSLIRKNLTEKTSEKKLSLEAAAELLYEDYLHDEELTAVTRALDGEDFYYV
ncbi:MAG: hypothetical protein ACR2MG_03585 [Pyrinomonadaceae bacterium]